MCVMEFYKEFVWRQDMESTSVRLCKDLQACFRGSCSMDTSILGISPYCTDHWDTT